MKNENGYRKAWDVDMTSCAKFHEVNNDMTHNFYFLVKVRVWTGRGTFFRRRFVVWFDTGDLGEYYSDKDTFSKKDIQNYARDIAWSFIEGLPVSKECNMESIADFTERCKETIYNYNAIVAA